MSSIPRTTVTRIGPTPLRALPRAALAAGLLLLIVEALVALAVGTVPIGLADAAAIVGGALGLPFGGDATPQAAAVLLGIRLPRVVLGIVAGAGLSAAGAVLQAVFRNPLADPMLIGVSSGAALAVTATIVLGATSAAGPLRALGPFALPLAGFVGGVAATALLYRLATREGATSVATMLLAGIAINALAFAGIGLLTTIASNEQLRNITFWNFGSLGGAAWDTVAVVGVTVVVATARMMSDADGLNALALGEIEARHLGFRTQALKRDAIAWSALAAGFVVAVCGVIGFVALVAPHLARLLFGADNRIVVPAAAILGAMLLLASDVVGRLAVAPAELPIGIVTALIGAPFFLWLLVRDRRLST